MKKNNIRISFIIVSYNSCELTIQTIESILRYSNNEHYEVIVVDNNSMDNTEYHVKEKFPSVKWIQSGDNIGFGRANNLGVQYSLGDYLLFINSDTIVSSDIAAEFMTFFNSHDNDCILGARLIDINGNPNTSFSRNFPGIKYELENLLFFFYKQNNRFYNITEKPLFINGPVSGACFFMKKSTFNDLNGFNEKFFLYYEETDLFVRAKRNNIDIISLPQPCLIHLEGGSEKVKEKTLERSYLSKGLYFSLNISRSEYLIYKTFFYFNALSRLLFYFILRNKAKVNFWLTLLKLERKYV
ncbi:hypothetical protein C9J21_03725 [Photobacterium phosphoreum]|uniref:glycosyltransferase family 2 protein n=1 Tax=Photobacterium phosphoreum TaxID=659 RepID=UPI000D160220|nr:glycosyltransferase family 2 protein [Photobacterium phosphoreum]PSW34963.1 hypothetical protein C9J21_03725 [Photobacterium phosphoreum]